MKRTAFIPARFKASRFPGKLMKLLGNKPVIVHTFLNTVSTGLFDEVIVVTDHEEIASSIKAVGGKVVISQSLHESGTDRIAEVVSTYETDVVINVQGDEPFVKKDALVKLCDLFHDSNTQIGSLMYKIDTHEADDPNAVKVVFNLNKEALYFSRSKIPFQRDNSSPATYYKHIGIYGYKRDILLRVSRSEPTSLELIEKLEQLRMLENGMTITMAEVDEWSIAIDTEEDLDKANALLLSSSL